MKVPDVSYLVGKWRHKHPGKRHPTGTYLPSPSPPGSGVTSGFTYQYKADRA
jgi:hypothetical protein